LSNSGNERSVRELVAGIDPHRLLPISHQAQLLGISRGSFYYQPLPVSQEELAIKNLIDEIYTKRPFFGVRKMTVEINQQRKEAQQAKVNHKRIARYMQEMGLQAIFPGPNLSKNSHQHPTYPYLLRDIKADHVNHIWGTDITYIRLKTGFVYLVAFLDWFSRYILSWQISNTLDLSFVLEAAQNAIDAYGHPEYENSDQGSHFTSQQYLDLWNPDKTKISMDGRGRCMDNIFTERLWRTIKWEEVYLKSYESVAEAVSGIGQFIQFYNWNRPHQSLAYKTPAGVYFN
jgi:putative transposase